MYRVLILEIRNCSIYIIRGNTRCGFCCSIYIYKSLELQIQIRYTQTHARKIHVVQIHFVYSMSYTATTTYIRQLSLCALLSSPNILHSRVHQTGDATMKFLRGKNSGLNVENEENLSGELR